MMRKWMTVLLRVLIPWFDHDRAAWRTEMEQQLAASRRHNFVEEQLRLGREARRRHEHTRLG